MHCKLTRTDLHLAALDGHVEEDDGFIVIRRPDNPGYYWGNYLLLPQPPEASAIAGWVERAQSIFANSPGVEHVLLRWDGSPLSDEAAAMARKLEMTSDQGLELHAKQLTAPASTASALTASGSTVSVRRLDMESEHDSIVALNLLCDPAEQSGAPTYVAFKQGLRRAWSVWNRTGAAHWWGAFLDGDLVAQCGMVECPGGLGRFQSVETHPDFRRRGLCSSLITIVGEDALAYGSEELFLAVDGEGPAIGLYERLGFRRGSHQHSLLLGGQALEVRPEKDGEQATVRSVVTAAFGQPDEAGIVATLRDKPGVISLVAERAGNILGHALFSPVSVASPGLPARQAIALGPIAVRPSQQRRGIGSALIREGLRICREAGWPAVFVLGDPDYYGQFGWESTDRWGLSCPWDVPAPVFQVLELNPGGLDGWSGEVRYHDAFSG